MRKNINITSRKDIHVLENSKFPQFFQIINDTINQDTPPCQLPSKDNSKVYKQKNGF